jgi:hypothetical protein
MTSLFKSVGGGNFVPLELGGGVTLSVPLELSGGNFVPLELKEYF